MTDNLHPVDELLAVRAEMAALKSREDALKLLVLEMDPRERFGRDAEASVTKSERSSLDTKALRAEMGDAWVDARSKTTVVTTIRVRESV